MSRYGRDESLDCKVYVGDLPRDATEMELERVFNYYGPLKSVWVAKNPAGFAFVQFEDRRDADDAVRELDGTTICGERVRVERSSGKVRSKPWNDRGPPRGGGRRPFDANDRCYECGESGHYAYNCTKSGGGGGGGGGRRGGGGYGGGGGSRRRSRSRSRSYERRRKRSYSRSRSRSRGRSPVNNREDSPAGSGSRRGGGGGDDRRRSRSYEKDRRSHSPNENRSRSRGKSPDSDH